LARQRVCHRDSDGLQDTAVGCTSCAAVAGRGEEGVGCGGEMTAIVEVAVEVVVMRRLRCSRAFAAAAVADVY
jgi:hypothetical protein